jgi:thymidylate kinase
MKTIPLFIVEGPDACGKTTFARELSGFLGGVFWHMSAPCNTPINEAVLQYDRNATENAEANLKMGRPVVFDRHWPSEVAYAPVFRKDGLRREIDQEAAAIALLRPMYVFCMDPNGIDSAAERHARHLDPGHPYDPDNYRKVYKNYLDLIHSLVEEGHTVATRHFTAEAPNPKEEGLFIEELLEIYNRANPPGATR